MANPVLASVAYNGLYSSLLAAPLWDNASKILNLDGANTGNGTGLIVGSGILQLVGGTAPSDTASAQVILNGSGASSPGLFVAAAGSSGSIQFFIGATQHGGIDNSGNISAANLSGTNTGDQNLAPYALISSLSSVATTGAYSDLSGLPSLGTIAAQNVGMSEDVLFPTDGITLHFTNGIYQGHS